MYGLLNGNKHLGGYLVYLLYLVSVIWINMTKKDLDDLEKPDTMVHRGILSKEGNPSKVFMLLCVMCKMCEEDFDPFRSCDAYENDTSDIGNIEKYLVITSQ